MRTLTRAFVVVCALVGVAADVCAQTARPDRPYRGLFGGGFDSVTNDQLLTLTRNREWEPFERWIDIRIARLRRKVEADPDKPQAIRTVRGAGYVFAPPPRDSRS